MLRNKYKQRSGFSMLEVVFVIVVLGIVSSIGAEIIAKIYDSYILQRAQHRASVKTELAATQIANRLAYAIPGTVYRRSRTAPNLAEPITSPLTYGQDTYYLLQWVGYDADSFNAITAVNNRLPGWSGFCDLDASAGTTLDTPGSTLTTLAKDTITHLGGNIANGAVYFAGFGYGDTESNISIVPTADTTILLDTAPPKWVEQYRLAWTSYALEVDNNGDLVLHYNFTPSPATAIVNTQSEILMRNVTNFKFRGDGKTIRFKICRSENIGEDFNITSCKEKAVF